MSQISQVEAEGGEGVLFEVELALAITKTDDGERKYLVKWLGYPPDEATWEGLENLEGCADAIADFHYRERFQVLQAIHKEKIRRGPRPHVRYRLRGQR